MTRPKPVAVVARERLHSLLDERLAHPAVWVSGPPGSGKTTLLAGYAETRGGPALWYHLDADDAAIATFFDHLRVAAEQIPGGKRAPLLPAPTSQSLRDLPAFTRRFFRMLFARLPASALLMLDDYQEVPPDAPLHAVIACALAELPEGVRCIVASRAAPPPDYARLVANRSIVPLGWDELRLTADETRAIAHARQVTDACAIDAAHARADGWVAGLILLLAGPPPGTGTAARKLARSSQPLSDYFADIFAHALSGEARDVLLATAALSSVTGPVAVRLSGNEHAERVLRHLVDNHCFVDHAAGSGGGYRLHALFREFLLEALARRCTPGERLGTLRRAASALAEFGDDEGAAALHGEAGDWARAAGLVAGFAPRLLAEGRWHALQAHIAAFPPPEVAARPWLGYWLGASRMAVDPEAARSTLGRACDGFAAAGDVVGQMLAAASLLEIELVLQSDCTALDRWLELVERLIGQGVALADPSVELRVLSSLVATLTLRVPRHPKLDGYRQRSWELARSDAAPGPRVVAAANFARHCAWHGDVQGALEAAAIARPLLAREDVLPVHAVLALMSLADAAYARADHEEADALFARAFALAEAHGLSYARFPMHAADCWRRLDRGEHRAVASTLARLESRLAQRRGPDVAHFHFVKGWLALAEGNFVLARDELATADALAAQSGTPYAGAGHDLMLAVAMIELGEYAHARERVARFRATFASAGSPILEFDALLVDSYRLLASGEDVRCATTLRAALSLGRAHGYVQTSTWYARMMSRLCAFALEQGIETEYVRMLVRRRRLTPEAPLECWPWPVSIRTLGRFDVETDGTALRFEGKAQRKPIALAKALIALGGRDVPADTLIDILWPEPSEGDAQKALDITVHRLRKLLGSDDAIQVTDRRATLNPKAVWVDAWALERTLAPLVDAANGRETDIALLEAAAPRVLALYRGHFLAGEPDEAWQMPMRHRLAGRFQRFVLRLGEHWESRQAWRRAWELYARAVELDPLAESFYRRQMVCLQAQGLRAEAIEAFRRCRQLLSVTLGIPPTLETEAVYRQLRAQ